MRVWGIQNRINSYTSFGRKPTKEEEPDLKKTIEQAYEAMGTQYRVAITHGSCFPALGRDTHIGSPFGKAAQKYIKFLSLYGFNANQLGPNGQLLKGNHSPYNSSAFANNRLFIDLGPLTSRRYGQILTPATYLNVTTKPERTDKNYTYTDFEAADETYDIALKEAYVNFAKKVKAGEPNALALNKEFKQYLSKHNAQLTEEGIYSVLSDKYQTDDFYKWDNEPDSNLMPLKRQGSPKAIDRYNELYKENKQAINRYKFEQFIATKQIKENKEFRDKIGFKYFSDLLVGCSKMDHWRYREAFLDGYQMGAPASPFGPLQTWGIPVLNPRTLFIGKQLDLNVGAQFLKDKLENALEFCENVRIDHAMGLIEPYVIEDSSIERDENGNIKSYNADFMSNMWSSDGQKLDDYDSYRKILTRIVIPTLQEHGLDKDDAVWEDTCSRPDLFNEIYFNQNNLPRLVQLEYMKRENEDDRHWFLVGSHDSIPARNMVIKNSWTKEKECWGPMYLAGYLHYDPARATANRAYCDKIAHDNNELVNAKFAELMTSKKFQISFADILGITDDDVVYNIGGQERENNWKERISADFIDKYYENLSSDNPTALNIPEILKTALQAKLDMMITSSSNPDETRERLHKKYDSIINKLEHYAQVLKEKE